MSILKKILGGLVALMILMSGVSYSLADAIMPLADDVFDATKVELSSSGRVKLYCVTYGNKESIKVTACWLEKKVGGKWEFDSSLTPPAEEREMYIDKGQPMIMGTKTGQKHVRKEIDKFGIFDHHPEGMELDQAERIYYKQYELEYQIEGKRDNVKKADRLRLNLYFDPVRRSQELIDLDIVLRDQKAALQEILRDGTPLDDDATIKRIYRFFDLVYDEKTRVLKSFTLNDEKVKRARRESGFFANTTHGVDFDPITAQDHYKLRDEQEKYFAMMKGVMGADRQRNWSELGKEGRLLILFVAQVIGCHIAYIRKTKLSKDTIPCSQSWTRCVRSGTWSTPIQSLQLHRLLETRLRSAKRSGLRSLMTVLRNMWFGKPT